MNRFNHILAKSLKNGGTPLAEHLQDVSQLAQIIAEQVGLDASIAEKGAVLHDVGKVSPLFQQTLEEGFQRPPGYLFRHEIASLFFISLLNDKERDAVIDMVVAHHKSIYVGQEGERGILDLSEQDSKFIDKHLVGFEDWSKEALEILAYFGIETHPITVQEARENIEYVIKYCEDKFEEDIVGYSLWKGILNASDYMASALEESELGLPNRLFTKPDLSYYHSRKSDLYPLSLMGSDDDRKHTLVTAPTGAGKTDFLLRRCRGRVFYTLPFQASINAMYRRIKSDLEATDADVRLLHASSRFIKEDDSDKIEEIAMQKHVGASIKVLTPHQIAILVFGVRGYEALIADLKGCDIILDEIHTYSSNIQSIVLKIVDILVDINCRVHIGTATMPTDLYNLLFEKLGGKEHVYEVKLEDAVLQDFNRHILYKVDSLEDVEGIIEQAVEKHQKILFVCNRVKNAQQLYRELDDAYPFVSKMLIHSRYKRGDRAKLEQQLINEFNKSEEACIVVSTQVVEVSLDISFDLMITECAPIDAMIQRFGRINRVRNTTTIGKLKPIYILKPVENERDAKPYDLAVLQASFDVLPHENVLEETEVQAMIDRVYPQCQPPSIKLHEIFDNGEWKLQELCHKKKSILLEILDIDSVSCIIQDDLDTYENGDADTRTKLEIPVTFNYNVMKGLYQLQCGSHPYVIPESAYDNELGFQTEKINDSSTQIW